MLRNIFKGGVTEQVIRIMELMVELEKQEGAVDYIETVFVYMLGARNDLTLDKLVAIDREYRFGKEGLIMSAAEQLIEQGRQEGMKKGMKEKAIRTARKMLMKGMQIDDVVELTELPKDEVLKLTVENC